MHEPHQPYFVTFTHQKGQQSHNVILAPSPSRIHERFDKHCQVTIHGCAARKPEILTHQDWMAQFPNLPEQLQIHAEYLWLCNDFDVPSDPSPDTYRYGYDAAFLNKCIIVS